jgi:hypothetical protein
MSGLARIRNVSQGLFRGDGVSENGRRPGIFFAGVPSMVHPLQDGSDTGLQLSMYLITSRYSIPAHRDVFVGVRVEDISRTDGITGNILTQPGTESGSQVTKSRRSIVQLLIVVLARLLCALQAENSGVQ